MTISYPLSLPSGCPVNVRFGGAAAVAVARSPFTFSEQAQVWPGQIWYAEIDLPRMKRPAAEAWCCFKMALNGREGTFLMAPPLAGLPRGTPAGTPVVDGASQMGRTLATKGWTPNVANVLLAGDYLQLGTGSGTHLHKVLADVSADSSGEATLDLWPALRASPANEAAIVVSAPKGLWRMADNDMSWNIERVLYGITFRCAEAL